MLNTSPRRSLRRVGATALLLFAGIFPLVSATAQAAVTGEQRTAVVLVNFVDKATQPISPAAAHSLVFGTVSDFYWEASYQQAFLGGDTFGWFTVPVSSSTCDRDLIAAEGNKAAAAAGADITRYYQVVYMFPVNSGCGWSGTVGKGADGQRRVFINSSFQAYTVAHEIGHGFGPEHADGLDCGATTIGDSCAVRGYADEADVMGNRVTHFNPFHKEQMGWLTPTGPYAITTVTSSGRYVLQSYASATAGLKALKIRKGTDAVSGQPTWYYVEARKAVGFDAPLANLGNLAQGVLVRTGMESNGIGTSLLLDMTPDSDTSSRVSDFNDGALIAGASYQDPAAGITITVVAVDANGATVDVTVATAPVGCVAATPTLSVGPSESATAGSTVTYPVSLTNRDGAGCGATSFALSAAAPKGWSASPGASVLSLSPGATTQTTLLVTSASNAQPGEYGVGVGVASAAGSVHTAQAGSIYAVVTDAASVAPISTTLGTDRTSYSAGQTVYLSAKVSSDLVPVPGAAVRFTVDPPNAAPYVIDAISDAEGFARARYRTSKSKRTLGDYGARADVRHGDASASAVATFVVR